MVLYLVVVHVFAFRVWDRCTHRDWVKSTLIQATLTNRPDWNQPCVQALQTCIKSHLIREPEPESCPEPEPRYLVWSGTGWNEALLHFYTCTHQRDVWLTRLSLHTTSVYSHQSPLSSPALGSFRQGCFSELPLKWLIALPSKWVIPKWKIALPRIWCLQ